jgi:hypothetical protein
MSATRSTGTAFDWQGPSVFTLDKKMRQIASGVRGGQLASSNAREKLDEKKQVFVYSKGGSGNANTKET